MITNKEYFVFTLNSLTIQMLKSDINLLTQEQLSYLYEVSQERDIHILNLTFTSQY